MKKIAWTIAIVFLVFAGPVTAQFYRYIDQNGNLRFTDDYNKVPVEQRANIQKYHEAGKGSASPSRETVTETEKAKKPGAQSSVPPTIGLVATAADGTVSLKEFQAQIEKMKEQLEAEYLTLAKEKNTLAQKRDLKKTREELAAYNTSVDAFNQRAENYEKMSGKLKNLVDEYNAFVLEKNAKYQKP
jgi:uncharacterized protein (DUF342 family)